MWYLGLSDRPLPIRIAAFALAAALIAALLLGSLALLLNAGGPFGPRL
jgi:hypothetical protein